MHKTVCHLAFVLGSLACSADEGAYEAVDLFWGSGGVDVPVSEGMARGWNWEKAQTGNTHPGAVLPFGWVSVCAYTGGYTSGYGRFGNSCTGYPPEVDERKHAWGFSHFQHSGVGWIEKFYNYFQFEPRTRGNAFCGRSRLDDETARPGYYAATLSDYGVRFELTARRFAACHRYAFADAGGEVRLDLRKCGLDYEFLRRDYPDYPGESVDSCEVHQVSSSGWDGFIVAHGIKIWFALRLKDPPASSSSADGVIAFSVDAKRAESFIGFSLAGGEEAVARADEAKRVGFDRSREEARAAWADEFSRLRVTFADERLRQRFYSALYHSLVKPCDTGRGFVDFSTFWDIYRTELPLVLSLDPKVGRGILEHVMSRTETGGFSPICQIMDDKVVDKDMQATALPLFTLADGFFRGVLSKADYPRFKRVVERELSHADISNMSPTHTLDLSGACGAAAFVAETCNDVGWAKELRKRAEIGCAAYDPKTGLLPVRAVYYEGNHFNYSFRPHPGMNRRVALAGGPDRFRGLLDEFFSVGQVPRSWHPARDRMRRPDHFEGLNNECDMDAPFAYLWCGRVDRVAEICDLVRRCRFADGEGGCPGNNDSGSTGSWYVWSCLGLYPLTGTPYYLLTTPSAESAEIAFARGILRVRVERESSKSIYPVGYALDGKDFQEPWLRVSDVEAGGELVFRLADHPANKSSPVPVWL